ncbi:MAG: hypothetical protein E6J49_11745 [Chloroflexi bacterium]|nr:MAG: hypothetical protein E6J49_11745 [Chloroflexota bacterium]
MRPRERLVARGASSLSDDELVALVIGSGTKKSSALVRANELLRRVGGMRALGQADAIRLRAIGVSDVASIRLVQLIVALLNRKQRLLECVTPLYMGSVSGTPVRIAELFAEAIKRQAPAILMAHNHPSGDPTPSADDIRTTREAAHAGRILGIDLVDHLVFGAGRWVSLRRIGAFS